MHQEETPNPLILIQHTQDSGGWRTSIFDSYEAHKTWVKEQAFDLFKKKMFPLRIFGGLTEDVQPPDTRLNKPFKEFAKEEQQRFEHE